MADYFKIFLVALVTSVATHLLLAPYVLRFQGVLPGQAGVPVSGKVEQGSPSDATPTQEKLTAPNLEGMTVNAGQDRWRDKGLVIVMEGERDAAGADPGTIVQQRPAPGATLGAAKEVRVIVAKQAAEAQIPDVVGRPLAEARSTLVAAGFEVPEPAREASEKEKGTVLRQAPNPGAMASGGSAIQLVVAENPSIAVPKVTGMYLSAAKKALQEAGLALGKVRRVEHPELGQNHVLRQTPSPAEEVPPGTEVELVVVAPD